MWHYAWLQVHAPCMHRTAWAGLRAALAGRRWRDLGGLGGRRATARPCPHAAQHGRGFRALVSALLPSPAPAQLPLHPTSQLAPPPPPPPRPPPTAGPHPTDNSPNCPRPLHDHRRPTAGAGGDAGGLRFWQDVYGFSMAPVAASIRDAGLVQAVVTDVKAEDLVTRAVRVKVGTAAAAAVHARCARCARLGQGG